MNRKLLMAKARGFTISIEKMGEAARARQPSGMFGDDYNRLLGAIKNLHPELESLFPPCVHTFNSQSGTYFTQSTYSELDAYCEQIYQIASEIQED